MTTGYDIGHYFRTMVQENLYSNEKNLRFHLDMVFKDVDSLEGKTVLEIGGGDGLHSFYAAYSGAREVVCVEPETAGSTSGVLKKFRSVSELLGPMSVCLEPTTFQDFDGKGRKFDVILIHNSINHLDEDACVNLLVNDASRDVYRDIFARIGSLAQPGGVLIACDCSRRNFFRTVGVRNPIMPSIEWHKHQSPGVWADFLKEAGFGHPKIRWLSLNRLGRLGQFALGNKVMSYFLTSYFCLTMTKLRSKTVPD